MAAVLGLAVAVLPAVLDRCAESCEGYHDLIASAPMCHHATSTADWACAHGLRTRPQQHRGDMRHVRSFSILVEG